MSFVYFTIAMVVLLIACLMAVKHERYSIASVLGVTLIACLLFQVARSAAP